MMGMHSNSASARSFPVQRLLAAAAFVLVSIVSQRSRALPAQPTAKGQSSITVTIPSDAKDGAVTIHRINRTYDAIERPAREMLLLDQAVETKGSPTYGYSSAHVLVKA